MTNNCRSNKNDCQTLKNYKTLSKLFLLSLMTADKTAAKKNAYQDVVKYLSIVVYAWDETIEVKQVKGCAKGMT